MGGDPTDLSTNTHLGRRSPVSHPWYVGGARDTRGWRKGPTGTLPPPASDGDRLRVGVVLDFGFSDLHAVLLDPRHQLFLYRRCRRR